MACKFKKLLSIALFSAVLISSTTVYVLEASYVTSDKGLDFLTNVVGLDVAQYNVKVSQRNFPVVDPNVRALIDKTVKYQFSSGEDKMDVIVEFRVDIVVWCKIYPITLSPRFRWGISNNNFGYAKSFLERLQQQSPASYLSEMQKTLDGFSNHKLDSVTSIGEITQTFSKTLDSSESQAVNFVWSFNCNGIFNSQKALSLRLENGIFQFFCNNWDLFGIGGVEVKFSQAQAIQIAKENGMKKFSMLPSQIKDDCAVATLSMQDKGNYTLYPIYDIRIPFDQRYGAVSSLHGSVWADTGQVIYLQGV